MIESVRIGEEIVPLTKSARFIVQKMGISRDALGGLLACSQRMASRKGGLKMVTAMDVHAVSNGRHRMRPPKEHFVGKIVTLNLIEGRYNEELQLLEFRDGVLYVLRQDARQPPFLGVPLRYRVTSTSPSRQKGRRLVIFVEFYGLRKATAEDLNPTTD